MEQSQLIELIKTLNAAEKGNLVPFSKLDFVNNGKGRNRVVPLLEFCVSQPWHEPEFKIDKAIVWKLVFPEIAYADGKLEKVMVEALKVVKAFLITKYHLRPENEFQQLLDLVEINRQRGLEERYRQSLDRLNKFQENSQKRDAPHFFRQMLLEGAFHYIESLDNLRKGDLNIPNVIYATETYAYIRRIALLSRYLLQKIVTKLEVPERLQFLLDDLAIPDQYLEASSILKISFEIFCILKKGHPENTDIKRVLELMRTYENELDGEVLQEFHTYLRNFTVLIIRANKDQEETYQILHELYLDNLKRGFLHYEGKLVPRRYLLIAENALKIKELDWAFWFIEKYKDEIYGENVSKDFYRFNLALYFFAIGKYQACLDHIAPVFQTVDYQLIAKRLEIKALFEMESELFTYKFDAFKMFISRTSPKILSDKQRQMELDFINILTQINSSIPGDKKRADRIIHRLEDKKQAAEWRWLHEKASKLKRQSTEGHD